MKGGLIRGSVKPKKQIKKSGFGDRLLCELIEAELKNCYKNQEDLVAMALPPKALPDRLVKGLTDAQRGAAADCDVDLPDGAGGPKHRSVLQHTVLSRGRRGRPGRPMRSNRENDPDVRPHQKKRDKEQKKTT